MKKNLYIVTNLKVWSLGKNSGAPSFYNTLKAFNDSSKFNIKLITTERLNPVSELQNVDFVNIPKLKEINLRNFNLITRNIVYVLNQVLCIYYLLKLKKPDFFYGYEIEFIPALKFLSYVYKIPLVSRFQGSILYDKMNEFLWKLKYVPHYFSLYLKTNLTVMTDDGTKGDYVLENIRGNLDDVLFIRNGVEEISCCDEKVSEKVKEYIGMNELTFISISRLERWKRVDRSLEVFLKIADKIPNCKYIIVGAGSELIDLKLKAANSSHNDKIIFSGALNKNEVNYLLKRKPIFLTHYELSNVGNPLFEAMKSCCLVVTIENGDTGKIITDGFNGIISKEDEYLKNADKFIDLYERSKIEIISLTGMISCNKMVISWHERLKIELDMIDSLINV
jgi:glycosyltransferase involved in cell wall biosynthesis